MPYFGFELTQSERTEIQCLSDYDKVWYTAIPLV
ncbi:MAG: hypothetical protein ACJAUL_002316, partial [Paraglaciecola sp.]